MKRRPLVVYAVIPVVEDASVTAEEKLAEPEAEAFPDAVEAEEPVATAEIAEPETIAEKTEPEILRIIREAEEREATSTSATVTAPIPAPIVAEPAATEEADAAPAEDAEDDEQDQEIREMTVNGRTFKVVIRYSRSFSARMAQADETLKRHYSEIKRELLSYARVNARLSWKHDAFNCGRTQLVKIVVRGKNLCVYLALDPAAYAPEKYHHVDCSGKSAYAKVPMMLRVKSELGLRKAKQLIAEMMENFDIARVEADETDYTAAFPYRDTKTLIEEGLIKELQGQEIG